MAAMEAHQRILFGDGEPVVDAAAPFERLDLGEGCWLDISRGWLRGADTLLDALVERVEWHQGRRWMYERMVDDPRLSRWHAPGDDLPHPALSAIGRALRRRYGVRLNGPGLNYYRDGNDSVAPHRDRELRELDDTLVAIVTLGARRPFLVRPLGGGRSRDLAPASGDLLVMGGRFQLEWEHAVPKVRRAGPRVSASWRAALTRRSGPPTRRGEVRAASTARERPRRAVPRAGG
jgi:alkylated DNA repair dioxygenase AlkB